MNLPKPPAGHFWRVSTDVDGYVYVALRKRRVWGSTMVRQVLAGSCDSSRVTTVTIQLCAANILMLENRSEAIDALLGDYS